jgi:drug/metabolite transporter (DMT)-like permease
MPASSGDLTGPLAAVGAAACWAVTALAFEAAGRRIGALTLNLVRLVIAFAFLAAAGWFVRGLALPVDATPHAWIWLGLSGLIGFVFGDFCLYRAFLVLGARLSMLMMALVPPLTALIGWTALSEVLLPRDLLGMALTVTGIGWAILERRPRNGVTPGELHVTPAGLAYGFGGALGQAGGLILSKIGIGGYDAFAATQVRVVAGMAGYALLFVLLRWWPRVPAAVRDGKAMAFASLGAFFGPFLGVSLSLIAVRATVSGVAASLMALTPVLILPLVVLLRKERLGIGGVAGALVAVAGAAVLLLG